MQRSQYPFIIFLFSLFLSACSTDFQLEGAWKDIPVAYGFLSVTDTAHYIRLEKAFLEPGGDALEIARIPDSLYYGEEVQVQLERLSNGDRFLMDRVDANQEGYQREEGIFATQPNVVYKLRNSKIQLREGERIGLLIDRGGDKNLVTAETSILERPVLSQSSPPLNINWAYDRFVTFRWRTDPDARLFELRLLIQLEESVANNPGVFQEKNLVWVLSDDLENAGRSSQLDFAVLGEDFYKFLASKLEEDAAKVRIFRKIDIQVTGVGEELLEFTRVNLANSGITGSQILPSYTNLSEGRGIFSSRATAFRQGLGLSAISRDSLRNGIHTKNLNFQ